MVPKRTFQKKFLWKEKILQKLSLERKKFTLNFFYKEKQIKNNKITKKNKYYKNL